MIRPTPEMLRQFGVMTDYRLSVQTIERVLPAVFAQVDPVPDDVQEITDATGGRWCRNNLDPWLWVRVNTADDPDAPPLIRSIIKIMQWHAPVTWQGSGEVAA